MTKERNLRSAISRVAKPPICFVTGSGAAHLSTPCPPPPRGTAPKNDLPLWPWAPWALLRPPLLDWKGPLSVGRYPEYESVKRDFTYPAPQTRYSEYNKPSCDAKKSNSNCDLFIGCLSNPDKGVQKIDSKVCQQYKKFKYRDIMMNEKEDLKFCSRELNHSPRIVSYKKMWLFSRGENDTFLNCLSHDTVRLFGVDLDFSTDYCWFYQAKEWTVWV